MQNPELFDAIVKELGFESGPQLAAALGRNNRSASNWRQHGFPRARIADLLALEHRSGRRFSEDVRQCLLAQVAPARAA